MVLTMLGIIIGVAAVLAMLAIGDGAKCLVMQYGFSWGDIVFIPLTTAQDRFKGTHYVNHLSVRAIDTDATE